MKQAALLALTIGLIFMSGCGSAAKYEEAYTSWRAEVLGQETHAIEAVVTASDEETACAYTLSYMLDAERETVEVLAPELIAKIKAQVEKDDSVRLSYDGAILDTGNALAEELSPLMALPVFMDILREGHVERAWRETEDDTQLIVTDLEMPDARRLTLWQRAADMTPVYAELRSENRVEIKLRFTKFD
jgi:hypothetical protein